MPRLSSNRGFTLIEMVVTVAVMAILVSLSMPAIFEYLRQREVQNEEIALTEIRKALEAYLAHNGELPSDTASGANIWYKKLAGYTNLSEKEIANDVYGRLRTYVMYANSQREMFGNPVSVYYATVHSMGADGEAQDSYKNAAGTNVKISGISLDGKDFAAASAASWWKKQSGSTAREIADKVVAVFSGLQPGGEDHLMRFTNYSEVLDRYNLTVQRLDTLTQALETYSRSHYAERVSFCTTDPTDPKCTKGVPEKTIYYPRARPSSGDTEVVNGTNQNVIYEVPNTVMVDNSSSVTDAARRTGMENLMDELGLPRENCCSALEMASDGKPMPFYYFSNPRPRSSSGCGARPKTTLTDNETKLPARVTTKNSSTTCG